MVSVPDLVDIEPNNPDGCDSNFYYAITPGDPNYEAMHATLLAAYFSGKQTRFWVSGCGGQNGLSPKIISIFVRD